MMVALCSHCHGHLGSDEDCYLANVRPYPAHCCSPECAVAYQKAHGRSSRILEATQLGMLIPAVGTVEPYRAPKPDPLAQQVRDLQESLRIKNRALDALHYVWCTGTCESGVHRFGEHPPLTEELVAEAERQVARMRKRLQNGPL